MTELLEKGIKAVQGLPKDRQDAVGEMLLALATDKPSYQLTPVQIQDLKLSIAEADRGEFASDKDVANMWKAFGV